MSFRASIFGIGIFLLVCVLYLFIWRSHKEGAAPKRNAVAALQRLDVALTSAGERELLGALVAPAAIRDRTISEQNEFLRKALADEVSAEGIKVLAREGVFGPLSTVFSNEAVRWAGASGVDVSNCVAFRLEKNGVVAEVAIATNDGTARVIRCNNVKQMAGL